MRDVKRIGRLGVLAVGLGIGAAVASTGTASADDFQISIDGMDLFPTAGNTRPPPRAPMTSRSPTATAATPTPTAASSTPPLPTAPTA